MSKQMPNNIDDLTIITDEIFYYNLLKYLVIIELFRIFADKMKKS